MEKEMLVVAKFKEGEGKFEKFMGFMQSPEGLAERAKVAVVEKTVASVTPDKSAVMFKIFCTDEASSVQNILNITALLSGVTEATVFSTTATFALSAKPSGDCINPINFSNLPSPSLNLATTNISFSIIFSFYFFNIVFELLF